MPAFGKLGEAMVEVGVDMRNLRSNLSKAESTFKRAISNIKRHVFSLKSAFAAIGVGLLAKSFIEAAKTSERYRLTLTSLLGSQEKGVLLFKEMSKYAAKVPFEFQEIMGAATQLAGVMTGGIDEIKRWIPIIGDLAATYGLGIQETTTQVVRMYSAGAAAADRFRDLGISAMLGFQAGVKYSAEDTRKMLIAAWEDPESKFRGMTGKLADTWEGLISMLKDKWFEFRNIIMEAGVYDALKDALKNINQGFKTWIDQNEELIRARVPEYVDATSEAIKNFGKALEGLYKYRDILEVLAYIYGGKSIVGAFGKRAGPIGALFGATYGVGKKLVEPGVKTIGEYREDLSARRESILGPRTKELLPEIRRREREARRARAEANRIVLDLGTIRPQIAYPPETKGRRPGGFPGYVGPSPFPSAFSEEIQALRDHEQYIRAAAENDRELTKKMREEWEKRNKMVVEFANTTQRTLEGLFTEAMTSDFISAKRVLKEFLQDVARMIMKEKITEPFKEWILNQLGRPSEQPSGGQTQGQSGMPIDNFSSIFQKLFSRSQGAKPGAGTTATPTSGGTATGAGAPGAGFSMFGMSPQMMALGIGGGSALGMLMAQLTENKKSRFGPMAGSMLGMGIGSLIPGIGPLIGAFLGGAGGGFLPFQKGGVVQKPTLAMLGEKETEYVVPESKMKNAAFGTGTYIDKSVHVHQENSTFQDQQSFIKSTHDAVSAGIIQGNLDDDPLRNYLNTAEVVW